MADVLPYCMMPDGGDACAGYQYMCERARAAEQERDTLKAEVEQLRADLHGMQDGAALRDLRAENARMMEELTEARREILKLDRIQKERTGYWQNAKREQDILVRQVKERDLTIQFHQRRTQVAEAALGRARAALERITRECSAPYKGPLAVQIARVALATDTDTGGGDAGRGLF